MYTVVDHNGDNGWIPQFEGLVKYWDWMATRDFRPDRESGVSITHEGIKEIEQAIDNPQTPTQHFPPQVVFNIRGNYIERDCS